MAVCASRCFAFRAFLDRDTNASCATGTLWIDSTIRHWFSKVPIEAQSQDSSHSAKSRRIFSLLSGATTGLGAEYLGRARELTLPQEIGSIIDPVAASMMLLGSSAYTASRESSGENEACEFPQAKRAMKCGSVTTSIPDMRLI
jgi:hypothetical protein